MFLAIEFLDEFVFGAREAAWPLIRSDLGLTYARIGLLLTVPNLVGAMVQPLFGVLGDAGHRRRVILGGGATFVLALVLTWGANGFGMLVLAFAVLGPASGAFVSLSQASFMDVDPAARERNMARWVVAGSVGVVFGPLFLAAAVALGIGWRGAFLGCAFVTIPLLAVVTRARNATERAGGIAEAVRTTLGAIRRVEVLRWLGLLELTDLLGDVLLGFVALYFVDVAGATPAVGAMAVAVLGLAALAGDTLLLVILRRMRGDTWLRLGAAGAVVAYPAFLLVPWIPAKLGLLGLLAVLRAGWYAIPKARLFDQLHGASGAAVALGDLGGLFGSVLPIGLGALAQQAGLGAAMWVLLGAPVALLILLPRGAGGPAGARPPSASDMAD
jgi:FSR family fosmidomycin resistance protein-like MFS transporter